MEARITGVSEHQISVEIFGTETTIIQRELSWDWIDDARDHFDVGDRIMVKITDITGRDDDKPFSVTASARLAIDNKQKTLIPSVIKNCTYMGTITDIHKGIALIQLSNGANVMAHKSKAKQPLAKGDTVAFLAKYIDTDALIVNGIIIRIIRQARY